MSSVGMRIREERIHLGFSQGELADLVGSARKTQTRYETDASAPDTDYLNAIGKLGADIVYILTGERRSGLPLPAADQLPPRLRERLATAIEAVEEGLAAVGRTAQPTVKAELILAAYDILGNRGESASAEIIRLVRA